MPFTPSPLMGEGWGEGEEKHIVPPSLSLRDISRLLPNLWILDEGMPQSGRDPAFCPKGHLRLVLCCGVGPYSLIDRKRCGTSFPPARGGEFFGGLFWVI